MRSARSSGPAVLSLLMPVLLALSACVQVPRPNRLLYEEFRGGGNMRPSPLSRGLTPKGQKVILAAAPPASCSFLGLVSGVMLVPGERPLAQTREELERSLSWQPALDDMRNLAAHNGANTIVVDGRGHEEHHGEWKHDTYFHLYGRAFLCPAPRPEGLSSRISDVNETIPGP